MKFVFGLRAAITFWGFFLATPASACDLWNLSGGFTVDLTDGTTATGSFQQTDRFLQGSAWIYPKSILLPPYNGSQVQLSGEVAGNDISFHGTMRSGRPGYFEGAIKADGTVTGTYSEQGAPNDRTSWTMRNRAKCGPLRPPRGRSLPN